VSSIVNFGAFVDLGGVDGLVHVSELSWKHVDHPSEVVQVGQEVEVEILDVDLERERVSLSLKATQEDPWKEFERKYQAGEIIEGQVTKLVPFGAFVRVAAGIEGLVHISELSEQHVDSPESVLSVGDQVRVKVIEVDVARRRISLSMRQVGGAMPAVTEKEIEAEEEEVLPQGAPSPGPEAAAETEEATEGSEDAVVVEVAEETAPQAPEALEAAAEPAEAAPQAAPEAPEAPGEAAPAEEAPAADEDVSLEAILEDLRRREGRAE
jgi:small subunit ribosomal protein S1